ncbi:hypothetical protein C451_03739 [Halococcus thailandensis JCM 13552]|uniref:Uncharacterized protein n=1 Tax=Halococcus thailandensis JCM 13552 TaxID=1227457 RepID=M0NHN8_9EURY|nr:hypothetical protein C451_03739 [Halococcus thailandensis JCM 13552]
MEIFLTSNVSFRSHVVEIRSMRALVAPISAILTLDHGCMGSMVFDGDDLFIRTGFNSRSWINARIQEGLSIVEDSTE